MNAQVNGWTAVIVLIALVLGYGFTLVGLQVMIPAVAAQVAGNKALAGEVNQALQQMQQAESTRYTQLETRLSMLEKQKGK